MNAKIIAGYVLGAVLGGLLYFFHITEQTIYFAQTFKTVEIMILGVMIWIGIVKKDDGQAAQKKILEERDPDLDSIDLLDDRTENETISAK